MLVTLALGILLTSLLSGVLGLGGGMILMGLFALTLPVSSAMILHGVTQLTSNVSRAWLGRREIRWKTLPLYLAGSLVSLAVFAAWAFRPDQATIFLALGSLPFLRLLLPPGSAPRFESPGAAFACGAAVTGMQLIAGASGPILDVFFLESRLNKQEVVATKAMTQCFAHFLKLVYFGSVAEGALAGDPGFPMWFFGAAIGLAMLGNVFGRDLLLRLSEAGFRRATSWAILGLGAVCLGRGSWLLGS